MLESLFQITDVPFESISIAIVIVIAIVITEVEVHFNPMRHEIGMKMDTARNEQAQNQQ